MITVQLNKKTGVFRCEGHAGTAKKGEDLICAQVSALVYTLADAGECEVYEPGKVVILPPEARNRKMRYTHAVNVVMRGLELIAEAKPDAVQVFAYYSKK